MPRHVITGLCLGMVNRIVYDNHKGQSQRGFHLILSKKIYYYQIRNLGFNFLFIPKKIKNLDNRCPQVIHSLMDYFNLFILLL